MHDGFVSLRLSCTPQSSRFSRACVPSLPLAPPFPSSLGNATTSVSLAFPVSLARASYWPGPGSVLLSLRFAPGYPRTDSPAASRRQGLPRGRRGRRVEEETRGDRRDREDRSDAQVPRYTFSFHLPGALSETEKERKKEAAYSRGRGQEKFRPFPRDRLDSLSGSRESEFAIFATSLARLWKKDSRCENGVRITFLRIYCTGKEIMRDIRGEKMSVRRRISGKL